MFSAEQVENRAPVPNSHATISASVPVAMPSGYLATSSMISCPWNCSVVMSAIYRLPGSAGQNENASAVKRMHPIALGAVPVVWYGEQMPPIVKNLMDYSPPGETETFRTLLDLPGIRLEQIGPTFST